MTFSKYIIHHLDLSTDLQPFQDVRDFAHYCVFWYQSIPLGEAYLCFQEPISAHTFWRECIKAISPALAGYTSRDCSAQVLPLMQPELSSIQEVCAIALENIHPDEHLQSEVSVVICTRNRADYLRVCLEHLQNQKCIPVLA